MNSILQTPTPSSQPPSPVCDLCGSAESRFILSAPRLDGPLVRCAKCGLFYVIPQAQTASKIESESRRAADEMVRLAGRARELALVEPGVEEGEGPWRELTASERLNELKRFVARGRLLEIGCSTGELIAAAGASFEATGVEADERSCRIARGRGLDVFQGTLSDARFPDRHFDVVALYHVIEHFPSPRAELREIHRILKPGGWLALETPNIDNVWFRLLGARWRQFIPDHIFFFTPQTLIRMCEENGFIVREQRRVGKAMSARLFVSRLGRFHRPTARVLAAISDRLGLNERTLRLNLGDVMRVYAQKK